MTQVVIVAEMAAVVEAGEIEVAVLTAEYLPNVSQSGEYYTR